MFGASESPERASQIVTACAILHNILATSRTERETLQNQLLPDKTDPITLDHPAGADVDAITIQYYT